MKEAKAVVWAAKIAARRAALGERVLWLEAERMAAVAAWQARPLRTRCRGSPLPQLPRRW